MGLVAERLNLRLFIDGIEVPVIGAKCTFAEATVATAEIQVIATDQVYDIEPRSFITLFVYDNYDYIDSPTGERNAIRLGPQDLRRWKLLFAGELVAVSMMKQGKARAATLSCADHSNYWDLIRQHYINFSNAGVELFESAFLGVKQDRLKFFDVLTAGAESKLYIWLTQSKNAQGNPSLYLGVQRMLREMFFSVNDFYAEMFNRLRIGDSIVGLPDDETAAKLFQLQFFEKFIKNHVGGQGGLVTARQLVDGLLAPVFHTYVTVPCPRFDRKGAALGYGTQRVTTSQTRELTQSEKDRIEVLETYIISARGGFVTPESGQTQQEAIDAAVAQVEAQIAEIKAGTTSSTTTAQEFDPYSEGLGDLIIDRSGSWPKSSLNYTIVKPDTWFLAPPMCNVVFPHQYRSVQFGRNYLAEPTRMFLRTSLLFTGQDKWLTERFYAPNFESFNDLLYKQGGYLERLAGTNLPHERFVGLNPAMVWQNDLPAYVAKGPRREYLSQLTHYLFWKYKFGTRTVSVSGPLNLNLVPGYPGLVMDRVQTDVGVTRHFIGNVGAVVHSVDQMGGWTHFSMAGARVHDEQVDFDDGGRSLEEVVARGTDGFLDDRYNVEKIGPDVYETLFGCGSAVDILDESEKYEDVPTPREYQRPSDEEIAEEVARLNEQYTTWIQRVGGFGTDFRGNYLGTGLTALTEAEARAESTRLYREWTAKVREAEETERVTYYEDVKTSKGDFMILAVEKLHRLYAEVAKQDGNVDRFTKGLTNRPKATFPEMMGTDLANVPPARNEVTDGTSNGAIELMHVQDPSLLLYDGFFCCAVNPRARTTKNNQYLSHYEPSPHRTGRVVETEVPDGTSYVSLRDEFNPETGEYEGAGELVQPTATEREMVITNDPDVPAFASYPLTENLEARREKVQAYVDSLVHRGMRG